MRIKFLNDYFGFNKQQRRGLVVLCVLSFLLLVVRLSYSYFLPPSDFKVQWIDLKTDSSTSFYKNSEPAVKSNTPAALSSATFNPNTCDYETLLTVGFPKKTAGTFLKFRKKGFVLREKKDLLKVYGVSEQLYKSLEARMVIEPTKQPEKEIEKYVRPALARIELNSADTSALQNLAGIGPVISKRIIKYRERLGGFYAVDQLKEVYGISDELLTLIRAQLSVDTMQIKKLYPSIADFKVLSKHPYIGYELSKKISYKRDNEALNFAIMEALIGNGPQFQRLRPYLAFAR